MYAEIYHVKSYYGCKEDFGSYRDPAKISECLRGFYEEAGVSPSSVEYVEGFGAGRLNIRMRYRTVLILFLSLIITLKFIEITSFLS